MDEQAGQSLCRPEPDHQRSTARRACRNSMEEKAQERPAQTIEWHQARGKAGKQNLNPTPNLVANHNEGCTCPGVTGANPYAFDRTARRPTG
ncbi:hypothetical protein EMIT0P43_210039 [Pseudomonas jessenii]